MSIGELLRQWAELEPDFCEESGAHPGCWYVGESGRRIDPVNLIGDDLGVILVSVIAALEVRGWEWQLTGDRADDKNVVGEPNLFYHAEVFLPEAPGVVTIYIGDSSSVATALLKAYLEALSDGQEAEEVSTPS